MVYKNFSNVGIICSMIFIHSFIDMVHQADVSDYSNYMRTLIYLQTEYEQKLDKLSVMWNSGYNNHRILQK